MLTAEEQERYRRHLMLPEVGPEGQERLRESRVLVIGAGGLGSPAALYLAAAGIGTIGIADGDRVELSNLQRQVIHDSASVGQSKTASAAKRLQAINPACRVEQIPVMLDQTNLPGLLKRYDFVLDATDTLAAKFMINDICVSQGVAFSHGGILRFQGQTMTVRPGISPCYRCLFDELPPEEDREACERDGVFGLLPGVIGTLQAAEAVKFLLGIGSLLTGRLLTFDLLGMRFREVPVAVNPRCSSCGER
ncbi:MAG: HesA/MoeB/ThiF family protein [Geobacteraceae bacterium]|nr:HesA/MoeB/ThiF family protein [Geobacteraceae bacterium]